MTAEWNIFQIDAMSPDANLLNRCCQMEQEYVDWKRTATYKGSRLSSDWPFVGEMRRLSASEAPVVRFVTTYRRQVEVQRPDGFVLGVVPMRVGMADQLYALVSREWKRQQQQKGEAA